MNNKLERAKKNLRGKKGFSLVELIIVIAIMAALVAILAPQYTKYVDRSRQSADAASLDEILKSAKVAAVDPTSGVSDGTITLTVTASTGVVSIADGTGTDATGITDEMISAIGGTASNIATMKSTLGKGAGTITIVVGTDFSVKWGTGYPAFTI